jgi:hypothetical protein
VAGGESSWQGTAAVSCARYTGDASQLAAGPPIHQQSAGLRAPPTSPHAGEETHRRGGTTRVTSRLRGCGCIGGTPPLCHANTSARGPSPPPPPPAPTRGVIKSQKIPSNNDKGDVENTTQVLAELKKQQREAPAPFKAPQMDAPVQYTVLTEIPATNPADAHSLKKFGLHQPRPSPDSPSSVTGSSTAAAYHTASSCVQPACHALGDL